MAAFWKFAQRVVARRIGSETLMAPPPPGGLPRQGSVTAGAPSSLSSPLILALEPRLMFDASVAVTAAAVDVAAQDHSHAANIDARPVALEAPPPPARHDVVFVDGNVAGASQIAQTLPSGTEVVMLDGSKDGFAQMASYLAGRHDIDSIALISHGSMGAVQAGSVWLTADTLAQHADALKAIGASLTESGDLLLYGCRVGQGSMGQQLLDQVAALTSADVAGSTDDTGASARGGNWTLERSTGSIEARSLSQDAALTASFTGLLASPGFETFDAVVLPDGRYVQGSPGAPYTLNGWKFQVNLTNGNIDPNSSIDFTNDTFLTQLGNDAGDIAMFLNGSQFSTTAILKSANSDNFNFHGISLSMGTEGTSDFIIVGYQDDIKVPGAETAVFSLGAFGDPGVTVTVSGSQWENVDEIRIIHSSNTQGMSIFVDDINVTAAPPPNVPPAIVNLSGDAVTYFEKAGPVLLDVGANALVTDSDSPDFNGGKLTVNIVTNRRDNGDELVILNQTFGSDQITVTSQNVSFNGTLIGSFTGGVGTNALVVSLVSGASKDAVSALIKSIAFNHSSTDPGTLTRTVSFTLNDGDSLSSSTAALTTVNVVANVNDAPTVTATPISPAPTYTENGASQSLFKDAAASTNEAGQGFSALTWSVSNVSDGSSEILRIDGTDVLLVNGMSTTTSTLGASVTVSVSGGVATVSLNAGSALSAANVAALLNGMTYRDTSDNPTGGVRTVTLTSARDNGGTSNGGNDTAVLNLASTVTVVPVNDAPVLTTSGGSAAFTAGDNTSSTPIILDAGLTLSDIDNTTAAAATVAITGNFRSGEDQLIFINNNSALYGNIAASYNAGTGVMTMTSSGATATLSQWQAALRSVRYSDTAVTPNASTRTISFTINDGTSNSITATRNVTVTPVDQTPLLGTSGGSGTFTEGQGPIAVDAGLSVSDLDNSTLSSATVQISGNFRSGEDLLLFTNTSSVTYGNITGSYNAGTGTLTLTSAGSTATVSQWQAALRSVNYANTSFSPDTSVRTVSFAVSDGVKLSATSTRDVNVISVDFQPVVTPSGGSATFTEGNQVTSTPVVIDSGITVTDADSTTLRSASVAIVGNFEVGADVLGFTNTSSSLFGNIVGSYDAATGVLTLTSAGSTATVAQFQAALRAVTYTSTSESPSPLVRSIGFAVEDGAVSSAPVLRDLNVVPVNDTPQLNAGTGSPVFAEGDGTVTAPVLVAPGLTVSDADNVTFASALVSITGNLQTAQDSLTFLNTDAAVYGNISGSYNAATGVLSLVSAGGTATVVQWEAALRAVTYSNSSEAPSTASRVISFTVNDGTIDSNTVTRTVAITSANDTPINTLPAAGQRVFQDGTLVFGTAQGNAISISDADAGNGLLQVTLTVTQGTLSLGGITGLSFAVGTGSGDATMTFSGSLSDINAALQGLSFRPTAGYNGAAQLQITTDDLGNTGGPARSDTDTLALTVDPINPVVTSVSTPTPDGGYKVGDTITTTLTFDQAVVVDVAGGRPTLLLETGSIDRQAVYQSGSGTNTLTFTYVVQAGDVAARLDYASTAALTLNGASIRSATQYDAVLDLPAPGQGASLAAQHAIQVDGVAPVVTGVRLPPAGTYVAGQTLDFTVDYSEAVTLSGTNAAPRLAVTLDGGQVAYADYVSGAGSSALVFRLTVAPGQSASGGITLAGTVDANGAVVRDGVGNAANAALTGLGATTAIRVDAVLPTVSDISRLDGSATNGQPVRYQVTFSEAVSGVDVADFRLTTTGNAGATITGLTQVDSRTYVVEVGGISGAGQVSLQLAAAASGIADSAGNALGSNAEGPAYAIAPVAPPPLPPAEAPAPVPALQTPVADNPAQLPVTFEPPQTIDTGLVIPPAPQTVVIPVGAGTSVGAAALPVAISNAGFSIRQEPTITGRLPDSTTMPEGMNTGRSSAFVDRPTSVSVAAGEPLRIALPVDVLSSLNRDGPTTVEVRQANGQPLPSWLRYDPVTGTLVGRAPAGLSQKIAIEVVVRDAKGQRAVSTIEVEVKGSRPQSGAAAPQDGHERLAQANAARADVSARAAAIDTQPADPRTDTPAGRPGLASQFSQHGRGAWQAEQQHWEQVLTDASTAA